MTLSSLERGDLSSVTGRESALAALVLPGATVAFPRLCAWVLTRAGTPEAVRDGIYLNYLSFGDAGTLWSLLGGMVNRMHADAALAVELGAADDAGLLHAPKSPSSFLLNLLALHPNAVVRGWVAGRVGVGLVLDRLMHDASGVVRSVVGGRSDVCSSALGVLAGDSRAVVRAAVARNVGVPVESLVRLGSDSDSLVRLGVAVNTACPGWLLDRLAGDECLSVVLGVVRAGGVGVGTLVGLLGHEVGLVRSLALGRLRGLGVVVGADGVVGGSVVASGH